MRPPPSHPHPHPSSVPFHCRSTLAVKDQKIPSEDRRSVRDYIRKTKALAKRKSYRQLIDENLSLTLRQRLSLHVSSGILHHVWWLESCEVPFLNELSDCTTRESFAVGETISCNSPGGEPRLCILLQGVACRAGMILTTGATWGDIIVASRVLRDTRPAKAIGYCEIAYVPQSGVHALLPRYPQSAETIRLAGLKLATRRAMVVIALHARFHRVKRSRPHSFPMPPPVIEASTSSADGVAPSGLDSSSVVSIRKPAPPAPSEVLLSMRRGMNFLGDVEWREEDKTVPRAAGSSSSGSGGGGGRDQPGSSSTASAAAAESNTPLVGMMPAGSYRAASERSPMGRHSSPLKSLNLAATAEGGVSNAAVMAKLDRLEDQMAMLLREFSTMREGSSTRTAETSSKEWFGGRLAA